MNNPSYKILIFVFLGKHKVLKADRMSDRRIHTTLTNQSKAYLPDRPSEVPELILLYVVTKDHPQTTHRVP